jgi:cytidylate kinase
MEGKLKKRPIVTIDGPAGAGKSTVSKRLASCLSFVCLDTGALYRAVAYQLKSEDWDGTMASLADPGLSLKVSLAYHGGAACVKVKGEDVSDKIRTEEIGLLASKVSAVENIRRILLPVQREAAAAGGVVAEGRDMGSVVFPDADVKFFLDASLSQRARRRYLELTQTGKQVHLADIEKDLLVRDRQDTERPIAPLVVPKGAIVIDSSDLYIDQVVDLMASSVKNACP